MNVLSEHARGVRGTWRRSPRVPRAFRRLIHRGIGRVSAAALLVCCMLGAGCAPGLRSFRASGPGVRPDQAIAILPLTNLTTGEAAPSVFTQKLLVELGRSGLFRIQDPGLVIGALRRLRVLDPDRMSAEQMAQLAAETGADFFLAGVISEFAEGEGRVRKLPTAALALRVIDATNGQIVWAASLAREGDDGETFFGLGRIRTADRLAESIAKDLTDEMRRLAMPGPPPIPKQATKEHTQ